MRIYLCPELLALVMLGLTGVSAPLTPGNLNVGGVCCQGNAERSSALGMKHGIYMGLSSKSAVSRFITELFPLFGRTFVEHTASLSLSLSLAYLFSVQTLHCIIFFYPFVRVISSFIISRKLL